MSVPPIDAAQADRFLSLLGKEPATARLRAFPHRDNPNKWHPEHRPNGIKARKGPYDLAAASRWQQEARGVYLVVNDGGDTDAQITACRAFFLEWDDRPVPWQLSAWQRYGLGEPTISITTGGKSAHLYWVLSEPIPPVQWIPIQAALIEITGADSTNRNPSRVMRLPGASYIGADGSAQGMTTIYSASSIRYSLEQIAEWVEPDEFADPPPESGPSAELQRLAQDDGLCGDLPPRPPEKLREALLKIPPFRHGAGQYQQLMKLAMRLHVDLGPADAQQLLRDTCCREIRDLPSYFRSTPNQISPGSTWAFLRETWGVDISRPDLKAKPPPHRESPPHRDPTPAAKGQQQPSAVVQEPPPLSYRDLLSLALDAVRNDDEDAEMELRAEIMGRFRRNDGQITAALFRLLSAQMQAASTDTPEYRSIDLGSVVGIDWLLEGFIPANDQALLYAPAGAGKTTAALAMAFAITDGTGFLDHDAQAIRGNALLIASDSGAGPLIRTLADMGRGEDPAISATTSGPRLHVWAHEPDQGAMAWEASLRGCLKLLEFVQAEGISLVLIDSCKAVTSKADLNYCDNGQVTALLTFCKEVLCRHCSVVWINHEGTGGAEAAGAKAWKEVPSIVHSIELVPVGMEEDGACRKTRNTRMSTQLRSWRVRKCRQGTAREFHYQVDENTGRLVVSAAVEVKRDCRAHITEVLAAALLNGRASLSRKAICEELFTRFGYSRGTVANSLTRITGGRNPEVLRVGSLPGHYRLAPRVADAFRSAADPLDSSSL
ncbi:MAG: AAA family ATPase [Cyanobium sp.]